MAERDSQQHGQAHYMPALCKEGFCALAREPVQKLRGKAAARDVEKRDSLDTLSCGEREGWWGIASYFDVVVFCLGSLDGRRRGGCR